MEKQPSKEFETISPRQVLILDACGASTTALMIYVLLVREIIRTGLPNWLLMLLAGMAVGFASFDGFAYFIYNNARQALLVISGLNLLYCLVVLATLVVYRNELTVLGFAYFMIEVAIVMSLASWEWILACR